MPLDTGPMRVLTQLQAEVELVQREMTRISEAYSALRRVVGLFYDAGCEDEQRRQKGRHRHLKGM